MLTQKTEIFTVEQAINDGLFEAVKRGETKICGYYECFKDDKVKFAQQNFVFKDKAGNLRVGRFADDAAVAEFITYSRTGEI